MKNGENLRDQFVKRFFNISGDFDEYKRQETNRIGTNVMMMCLPAILIPSIVAGLWATKSPEDALLGLIFFNVIFVGVVICPYLMVASRRAHLTDNEVDVRDLPAARRSVLKRTLGSGLYGFVFFYLMQVILNFIFDHASFVGGLTSSHNIKTAILTGIILGTITGITYWMRLKKQR
ncbi:hypothetical protein FC99_GL000579 [Levilactobacillus koreensis JCM 16448]|uniref:DUF3278 domain-containing protein n=1 Tax=Levilactobacillus koreensis TaxID=637971 RepID=UPI000660F126|nr:DUF3278 domain-containing protein [Levilactobacillus koreensis]KRK88485.1 hypothetical protein FC99_GL000579 [Levilactobacillus koreensis JCM 16448]